MFKKLVVFKYYDGPLSGIGAEDEAGEIISRFDLLSWDDLQDRRIFCVGRIYDGDSLFKEVVDFYKQFEEAHWPIWVPNMPPAGNDERWSRLSNALDMRRAYQSLILASQIYDEPIQIEKITGDLDTLVQKFIQTGELQDFESCKSKLDARSKAGEEDR